MFRSQSAPYPSLLPTLALSALALAAVGLLDTARAGDDGPSGLAIPTSGTNVYGLPPEQEIEVWTGHLGGDCQPKRLQAARILEHHDAILTSGDTSTLAYVTSTSIAFERREGFSVARGHLQSSQSMTGVGSLVLSDDGRRGAYVTHEGPHDLSRTTLWLLDLGAATAQGPQALPAKVTPRRIKRGGPGTRIVPAGWSPDGQTLIYFEATPVRGRHVSVLVARDVRAQTEEELARSLKGVDFALPFQTGPSAGSYGVLVGDGEQIRWVYPSGAPDQVLRDPRGVPLVGQGVMEVAASRRPLDLMIRLRWPALLADGRVQSGVYRVRGGRITQLTSERDVRSISYEPEGLACLVQPSSLRLFADKTDTSLEFLDADENPRRIRATDWHASQSLLALAFDEEILVLDLSGQLPNDAAPAKGWSQFVGLRAPGSPKPSLHRVVRFKGSKQCTTSVLWHGGRLVWTRTQTPPAGFVR